MKKCLSILCLLSVYCQAQVSHGKLHWTFQTDSAIVTTPCISGDKLYFGNNTGNLFCNRLDDGTLMWKFATHGAIRSTACVSGGQVFFSSVDGKVYALDATTGKLKWTFNTQGEKTYDLWDYYTSSPVVDQGTLYIGSGDDHVYAIDANNGKARWTFATGGIVHADPVLKNDTLYIGSFDGFFYAIKAATGALCWKFKTTGDRFFPKGEIQKAALVSGNAVYFGSRDYNIYALNRRTGTGLWNKKEFGSWIIASPIEIQGQVYFGTSDSHVFYSLNTMYGEENWKADMPMRIYGTAASADSLVFAACFDGCIYGLGRQSGQVRWRYQTEKSKANYDSVYDHTGHLRKDFITFGSDSITRVAEQKILNLGAIMSSPVIVNGIIYFGSADGKLYAVKIAE